MKEAIIALGHPLADRMMRKVAIIANSNMAMARFLPRVVVALHDMAISARGRIIAQVAPSLTISKRECTDAAEHAQHQREHNCKNRYPPEHADLPTVPLAALDVIPIEPMPLSTFHRRMEPSVYHDKYGNCTRSVSKTVEFQAGTTGELDRIAGADLGELSQLSAGVFCCPIAIVLQRSLLPQAGIRVVHQLWGFGWVSGRSLAFPVPTFVK